MRREVLAEHAHSAYLLSTKCLENDLEQMWLWPGHYATAGNLRVLAVRASATRHPRRPGSALAPDSLRGPK